MLFAGVVKVVPALTRHRRCVRSRQHDDFLGALVGVARDTRALGQAHDRRMAAGSLVRKRLRSMPAWSVAFDSRLVALLTRTGVLLQMDPTTRLAQQGLAGSNVAGLAQ